MPITIVIVLSVLVCGLSIFFLGLGLTMLYGCLLFPAGIWLWFEAIANGDRGFVFFSVAVTIIGLLCMLFWSIV